MTADRKFATVTRRDAGTPFGSRVVRRGIAADTRWRIGTHAIGSQNATRRCGECHERRLAITPYPATRAHIAAKYAVSIMAVHHVGLLAAESESVEGPAGA